MWQLWVFLPVAGLLVGSPVPPPAVPEPELPRLDYALAGCAGEPGACFDMFADAKVTAPPAPAAVASAAPVLAPSPPENVAIAADREPSSKVSADGPLRILVSIPQQKLYVFEGDELVATSPASTGKRGHETPLGTYRILQKRVEHYSNLYDNAPMPYMQRLTNSGIAIHAGSLPGRPASHGCIRLPWSFAKKLYGLTNFSTKVTVTNKKPKTTDAAMRLT